MASADQLFNQFVEAWNSGRRPDVDDFTAQVPEDERSELRSMVTLFLEQAQPPPLDDEARAALRADPAFKRAAALAESQGGLWSELLPRLRKRIEMTREQLVAQLAGQLSVERQEQRVGVYYHRMETGQLDPAGVSQRVLDALAKLLRTDVEELEEAGAFRGIVESAPVAVYMRSDHHGALATAPADEDMRGPDEVDRLFTGGR